MSNKLELLRQKFASRKADMTTPNTKDSNGGDARKKGRGSDVRAIVLKQGDRRGRNVITCFLHSIKDSKLGEKDRVDGETLCLAPRTDEGKAPGSSVAVKEFSVIDVTNHSKTPDPLELGDAIWLCNLSAKAGDTRTFYDASFARRDYTITGYSALQKSSHSMFYVPRFNPDSYDNDVLLPVAPFPTDDSQIPNPGVFAQLLNLDEDSLVQDRDNTICARFSLSVTQWKTDLETDAVNVSLPSIRCWDSTLGAFGIQNPAYWSALAPTILNNVPFYLRGYAHKTSTASLLERVSTTDDDYALSIRVLGIVVDPEVMLRKVAMRVPETYARSLLPTSVDASSKNYWNENKTLFFNASESSSPEALAGDQWYVMANIPTLMDEKTRLDGMDNAGRQAWLESASNSETVFCVFLRSTKKRSAESAGLA